ncbi:MAG: 2-oxoisovalerate dehydrogenase subunit beta [Candidatus Moanabacter tarae]|uniref:2-oxoisovalerate dehydrogenase subunit beta n=1 Tax=Candidatus Moanibacter tarae TaxID=2200854 RepID=A0A2Z4AGC7_9BACT|nr:MAG: 2-oxoisovalerate dehydrogenase subunit beta [Candidatus Moanabacter tarae]
MQLIRRSELRLARSHQQGLVHGACHTYVGEEAIACGVCAHLRLDDIIFSTHRGHGHALAKGLEPKELMAELYGRDTGCSRGRGGSMHLFKPEIGLMGTSGIVGPCILQACGGGYSFKILRTDQVAVAFFGDGAVNNGAFHEGLNMAAIWKLPVIFVCENNEFATEVAFEYASGIPDVGRRAKNYGLPGFEVDGNDVAEVHRIAGDAVQRARAGEGATLIECKTYRTRAHAEGMVDFTYRTRDEVDRWKTRCPIERLRNSIIENITDAQSALDEIDEEINEIVDQSHSFAEKSAFPDSATAKDHVYSKPEVVTATKESPIGTREKTYVDATLEALDFAMAQDETIFVMGQGIGKRGGNFATTLGLFDKYGADRLCDTPLCERGFVGLGCGAAVSGTRPVIDCMFIDFINDSFGELVNQIAKMQYMSSGRLRVPIILRGCIGVGHSAATHHSGSYHSIYAHIPGLRVVLPSTPFDAKGLFAHALRSWDPVLFLEHRELMATKGPVPEEWYEIPFGEGVVAQEGTDVTVVAFALMCRHALKAAERLSKDHISVEVIDPRTASPLDLGIILDSVNKTGRILVIDEAFGPCGIASEIAARVSEKGFNDLDAPVKCLTGDFTPTPYSPSLEAAVVPNVDHIENSIRQLINE